MIIARVEQDDKGRNIAIGENGEVLGYVYIAVPSEGLDRKDSTFAGIMDEGE